MEGVDQGVWMMSSFSKKIKNKNKKKKGRKKKRFYDEKFWGKFENKCCVEVFFF